MTNFCLFTKLIHPVSLYSKQQQQQHQSYLLTRFKTGKNLFTGNTPRKMEEAKKKEAA